MELQANWWLICEKIFAFKDSGLRSFYIQFLHRGYHMNTSRIHYINCSANCSLYDSEPETYLHLFWECPITRRCWEHFLDFCNEFICTKEDVMSKENYFLSNFSYSMLVLLTVSFKKYLFMSKVLGQKSCFLLFLSTVKKFRDGEFLWAKFVKSIDKHNKFWGELICDEVFLF